MTDHKAALARLDGMTKGSIKSDALLLRCGTEFKALYAAAVGVSTLADGSPFAAHDVWAKFNEALTALTEKINAG